MLAHSVPQSRMSVSLNTEYQVTFAPPCTSDLIYRSQWPVKIFILFVSCAAIILSFLSCQPVLWVRPHAVGEAKPPGPETCRSTHQRYNSPPFPNLGTTRQKKALRPPRGVGTVKFCLYLKLFPLAEKAIFCQPSSIGLSLNNAACLVPGKIEVMKLAGLHLSGRSRNGTRLRGWTVRSSNSCK